MSESQLSIKFEDDDTYSLCVNKEDRDFIQVCFSAQEAFDVVAKYYPGEPVEVDIRLP